jgi:hypothetical protein
MIEWDIAIQRIISRYHKANVKITGQYKETTFNMWGIPL